MLPIIPYVNRVENKHAQEEMLIFQAEFSSPTESEKMDQFHLFQRGEKGKTNAWLISLYSI